MAVGGMEILHNITLNTGVIGGLTFSGGERHIRVEEIGPHQPISVTARLASSNDIMDLLLTCDALDRIYCVKERLFITYFPYARQDRVCNEGEPLSAVVMARLINGLGFKEVVILHPHSPVVEAVTGAAAIYPHNLPYLKEIKRSVDYEKVLVAPDAGAEKMVSKLAKELERPMVVGSKVRDTMTGDILETRLSGDVEGKDCLIVDDICDGGRTFVELAKVLRSSGAREIHLLVTHGIFSKGVMAIGPDISRVYYTNSLRGPVPQGIDIIIEKTEIKQGKVSK